MINLNYQTNKATLDLQRVAQKLAVRQGERQMLLQQYDRAEARKATADADIKTYDLVQILLQKTSDYARGQAKKRIEDIVTQALAVVFGQDYKFSIKLTVKANQPTVEYWLTSGDIQTQLKPPDYDRGGGIADVISLALRLAVGELYGIRGPIFLDEVGKHVSAEYAPNVAYFLKEYSRKFNRQVVLITHNAALAEAGDVSVQVRQKNGVSEVKI